MTDIFISHAVADKSLARLFVDLLKEGIGVPSAAIFCSSLKGHGIPFTEDFNDYMKEQIQAPKLVVLIMTPAYLESAFCLMELGASWANSLKALPVVIPPVGFDTVSKTLGLKQAWDISDAAGLIDLRKLVRELITVEPRDEHTWEQKRAAWRIGLKKALKDLAKPTKVSAADHLAATENIAAQAAEIEALQDLPEAANEKIEALKAVKDAEGAKEALASFAEAETAEDMFEELLDDVKSARPKHATNAVFKHILLDHFDKAAAINWYSSDKDEFETAIQYKLLASDDGYGVQWGGAKLAPLRKAIVALDDFLRSSEGHVLAKEQQDEGVVMDVDDREFWEYHLDL